LSILENGTKKRIFFISYTEDLQHVKMLSWRLLLFECEVNQSVTSSDCMNHPTNLPG
jgi:hypothetical protein